jgi:hypothetical protein
MPAHQRYFLFGLGQIGFGRAVRVAGAHRPGRSDL